MALRLDAVSDLRRETTATLERARPVVPGRPVLGWFLVAVAAVVPVGLWFSFGFTERLVEIAQVYWMSF